MHQSHSTASLLMFKAEAKRLQQSALNKCPSALDRLAKAGFHCCSGVKHTACLKTIAKEYGYDSFQEIAYFEKLFLKFARANFANGSWRTDYNRPWSLKLFQKQYAAICEAAVKKIPLAKAARTKDVDFQGFQFSDLLYSRLRAELKALPPFDFSELDACGSYIGGSWANNAISFEKAKLAQARFFHLYADPAMAPGMTVYRGNFCKADLREADLRCAYLRGSDFLGANLDAADFRGANIFECRFTGAKGTFLAGGENDNETWVVYPAGRYTAD
ncbi:pentapeptide repeat-containing protein [Alcaligenaceae bacterium]|nr:pentapeptide repeat-containing protein [Alcaligenaceae bacterium]